MLVIGCLCCARARLTGSGLKLRSSPGFCHPPRLHIPANMPDSGAPKTGHHQPHLSEAAAHRLALPMLIFAAGLISFSGIFVKLSEVGPTAAGYYRMALAL